MGGQEDLFLIKQNRPLGGSEDASGGGEETKVLDFVHPDATWTVREAGIHFFTAPDKQRHSDLSIYEFASNKIMRILVIERPVLQLTEVCPDGRTILYTQEDEAGSDLMLVENFR